MKQLKARLQAGQAEVNEDDPFEMFVSMTEIRHCFYKETHKILGNTYKMCVLQVSILFKVSLSLTWMHVERAKQAVDEIGYEEA